MSLLKTTATAATNVIGAIGAVGFMVESAALAAAKEVAKMEAQAGDVSELTPEQQAEYQRIIARLNK